MGTFSVTVEVWNADRSSSRRVEALVDTGATFTWLPRNLLEDLGHQPVRKREFEFADGRVDEYDVGEVPVGIGDDTVTTVCVFADSAATPLLGAVTMEQLLLAPDPIHKRLVPVVGLAMKATTR